MAMYQSKRCYACGKLFCCVDCCVQHIKKKHPGRESECSLCRNERLLVKDFENQEFLCHVVFNHLPLHCVFCDEIFRSCADLKALGACNRRPNLPAIPTRQGDEAFPSPENSSPFNKTPCNELEGKRQKYSIDGDYNGNFGNFTSPPELARNTSTPMHTNLIHGNAHFTFKTPRSPNFILKTPKTTCDSVKNVRSGTKENSDIDITNYKDGESPNSESHYFSLSSKSSVINQTPLRSILSNRTASVDNSNREFSTTTGRQLGAMQETNEEAGMEEISTADMDLTDPQSGLISTDVQSGVVLTDESLPNYENVSQRRRIDHRDSGKRVRFSDQFEPKSEAEVTSGGNLNATEAEEFFEARQSISEMSMAVVEKLSASTALIDRENKENAEKEKTEVDTVEIKDPKPENSREVNSVTTSSSSRVIMMVVVEKNGSVNPADLAPLIDASLKKLEGVANSGVPSSGNSMDISPRSCQNETPGARVVSMDSYMSVSTVECYSTPDSTIDIPQKPQDLMETSNSSTGSGGIFSAVAQVVRTAFRNFSGTSSLRNITEVSEKEAPALLPTISESNAASSNAFSNLSTALAPRTAKRSRDPEPDADSQAQSIQSSDSIDLQNDIRSPVPKRPRGWYKIRAREPIARMRNTLATSPRGVSSETQCFQQGSLSVGDTILPIPSRAHQSTQTD